LVVASFKIVNIEKCTGNHFCAEYAQISYRQFFHPSADYKIIEVIILRNSAVLDK
jgi:hypothetical protein